MKLTTENMNKLIEWQKDGRRAFEIKAEPAPLLERGTTVLRVWCYDYDLRQGKHIKAIEELPTQAELKQALIAEKRAELERLEKAVA